MGEQEGRGLVFAYLLDGEGGGEAVGWDGVRAWSPDQGLLWVHVDHEAEDAREWLAAETGADPVLYEALVADETRPRCVASHADLLVILRGVNLNPGAEPDDMISVRMWLQERRVVTLRHRVVKAIQDVRGMVEEGNAPRNAGDLLVEVADHLVSRIAGILIDLDDGVDAVEDELLTAGTLELRSRLGALRRQAIALRRYLAPQRDAMARLQGERVTWLSDLHRVRLREIADRVTRYVEDLDSARDRAAVTQDELNTRLSDQMNRTMYVLSIVAAIFLPLGLLTGLLGINVGGIPGTESRWAFTMVCLLLCALAGALAWLFRKKHWF